MVPICQNVKPEYDLKLNEQLPEAVRLHNYFIKIVYNNVSSGRQLFSIKYLIQPLDMLLLAYRLLGDVLGYTELLSPLLSLLMDEFKCCHRTLQTLLPPRSRCDFTSHRSCDLAVSDASCLVGRPHAMTLLTPSEGTSVICDIGLYCCCVFSFSQSLQYNTILYNIQNRKTEIGRSKKMLMYSYP